MEECGADILLIEDARRCLEIEGCALEQRDK